LAPILPRAVAAKHACLPPVTPLREGEPNGVSFLWVRNTSAGEFCVRPSVLPSRAASRKLVINRDVTAAGDKNLKYLSSFVSKIMYRVISVGTLLPDYTVSHCGRQETLRIIHTMKGLCVFSWGYSILCDYLQLVKWAHDIKTTTVIPRDAKTCTSANGHKQCMH
jgi:hypothetical protein